jgi:putative transposase
MHRSIEGEIKSLTVTRSATGKWFACFSVKCTIRPLPESDKAAGVDVGLVHFATLSTGEQVPNPRFFCTDEKALAKAQRTGKRKAAQRIHERIANRRRDFAHQLSRAFIAGFGFIALENLNIKGMVKNRPLAKSISDAAWSQLIQYTLYKAESAGRVVRLVDPRNTSKLCSACGTLVEKTLAERVHRCQCGLSIDRDHNAALNILALGLQGHEFNAQRSRALTRGLATK